ncbi:class I SAM-dependent methyltransferase [Paramicrobacterium chengjingii]|uniref:Class I SAM-dependent methyltransferase n=1 Tax=Paramicrobacterium chengjingii TaxID=2769067 RepID=A0ABX6YIB8_9MICO|nr:class I SAM-dependent methyltransferase [Microbacterium chengjingii]QPZ38365.1 class I SAM-dependent methyltransferase [Microbacterium chengjingii]
MVTLPSPASDAPHEHRGIAEGFGADAERYDRARPTYPPALTDAIMARSPGTSILDVGIGTGLSSRGLRDAGCTVLGVEPDERMAAVARRNGFAVETSRFEEWDPAGHRVDTIIAGQTWHWVDPVAGARKAAQVLDPDGLLVAFWNAGDPDPDVAAAFADVYQRIDTGLPFTPWASSESAVSGYGRFVDATRDGLEQAGGWSEPERWRFDWEATITTQAWLDQVPTSGGHNRLAPGVLAELLEGLGDAIDTLGGSFTMHYATVAIACTRL